MFKIKICGVRLSKDVDAVAAAGGDAIGLNFYENSIRFLNPETRTTKEIIDVAGANRLATIGVFVNETVDTIAVIALDLGLTAVQLHGDESKDVAASLLEKNLQVIRAIKLPIDALSANLIEDRCGAWRDLGCHLLLDADAGAEHGGSGKRLDWNVVGQWAQTQSPSSWTLAGGLDATNVAEAIELTGARSVDTASGVEEPRGVKSATRIEEFIATSRQAFAAGNSH